MRFFSMKNLEKSDDQLLTEAIELVSRLNHFLKKSVCYTNEFSSQKVFREILKRLSFLWQR